MTATADRIKPAALGLLVGTVTSVERPEDEPFCDICLETAARFNSLEELFILTEGCERWITTSRRTPKAVEDLIDSLPFDYKLINSRESYNPIPAFIQECERVFVTSDSASMISECASFGAAKVEVLMNRQLKSPNKFEELIGGLEKQHAVHVFDGTLGHADKKIDLTSLLKTALNPLLKK